MKKKTKKIQKPKKAVRVKPKKKAVKVKRPVEARAPIFPLHSHPIIVQEPMGVEPFDVEDWMDEQGLKRGDWETYCGKHEKEFCEVRNREGLEVGPCWYSAGKFVRLDTVTEMSEKDVVCIRYFKPKFVVPHEEDEDGQWRRGDDPEDETFREHESDGFGD